MTLLKNGDCITLRKDIPSLDLFRGMIGSVLEVFVEPELAYEIEFCDEEGRTIAQVTFTPEDIAVVT